MAKLNKKDCYAKLDAFIAENPDRVIPVLKLGNKKIVNILFPQPESFGLMRRAYPEQTVRTAENPAGNRYPSANYRVLTRGIEDDNGKLTFLFDDKNFEEGVRVDSYCWTVEEVNGLIEKGLTEEIGTATAAGLLKLVEIMSKVENPTEKAELAKMFTFINSNFILAYPGSSERKAIVVDKNFPLTHIVDEWNEDEATEVSEGDLIIVTYKDDGITYYRVEAKIALMTYTW